MGRRGLITVALLVAALAAVAFRLGATDMWGRWFAEDTYYGHGPLIPLVSGWLIWRDRERLLAIPRGWSAWGLAVAFGAMLLLSFALLEDIHFVQNFALVAALWGAALALLGRPLVRAAWFPLAFLLVMVPLPQMVVANLTFSLKMLAAKLSVGAIDLAGIPVVLDGSTIHMPSPTVAGKLVSVTVEDVCSGLRTMVSLVGLSLLFAYFERTRWKAALTLALSVPIAIVANVVRILVLCTFAAYDLQAAHEGPGHEATGLAVFAVALVLLMGVRSLPDGTEEADEEAEGAEGEAKPAASEAPAAAPYAPSPIHVGPPAALGAALVLIFALGAAAALAFPSGGTTGEKTERTRSVPSAIAGWRGEDMPLTPRVFELLETEDVLMRRYHSPGGGVPVDLYVIHAADSRKVAHPPEMCFSGGGYIARENGEGSLDARGRRIPAVRMLLDRGGGSLLVYYWYRLDGKDTASYLEHQVEYLLRRLKRERREGSMVRLSTPVGADGVAGAEARIARFAREAIPGVLAVLP